MEQIEELSDQEDDITEEAVVEEDVPVAVDEGNDIVEQNVPPSWCPGGYDETIMEITSCGNALCDSCNWQN